MGWRFLWRVLALGSCGIIVATDDFNKQLCPLNDRKRSDIKLLVSFATILPTNDNFVDHSLFFRCGSCFALCGSLIHQP